MSTSPGGGPPPAEARVPAVSVVMTAFNQRRWLPISVASVLAQDLVDLELIVVDDGSTDDSLLWLKDQTDARLRIITQPNRGQSAARNSGIRAARGDYIALIDADDFWHPQKLSAQAGCLDLHPESGLVHTGICYVDENGLELNRPLLPEGDGDVWRKIVLSGSKAGVRCGSTPMIRSSVFDRVGLFDTSLSFSEDWDMWLRIAKEFPFSTIPLPLTYYRQHEANMTKSYDRIVLNQKRVLDKAFETRRASFHLRRRAYGRSYLFAAWRAYYAGATDESRKILGRAFWEDPGLLFVKNALNLVRHLLRSSVGPKDLLRR